MRKLPRCGVGIQIAIMMSRRPPSHRYKAWMLGNRVNCLINPQRHKRYWMLYVNSEETMRPARCKAEIGRDTRIPVVGLGASYSQTSRARLLSTTLHMSRCLYKLEDTYMLGLVRALT